MESAGTFAYIVTGALFLGLVTAFGWSAIETVVRRSFDMSRVGSVVAWSAVVWFLVAWTMALL